MMNDSNVHMFFLSILYVKNKHLIYLHMKFLNRGCNYNINQIKSFHSVESKMVLYCTSKKDNWSIKKMMIYIQNSIAQTRKSSKKYKTIS